MTREIICADALPWMAACKALGAVVTSLPDAEEIGTTIPEWKEWFSGALAACFSITAPEAPAIFYQTDRKVAGQTMSKAALVLAAGEQAGSRLLWHKIVLRRGVGATDLHRPGYSHLIAFSAKGRPGVATPDVMERGPVLYPNGIGINVADLAVRFAGDKRWPIIDPFCGRGTIPALADAMGFDAVGVDILPEQAAAAAALNLVRRGV